jgi:polynucleotide 5'-hydroxyl-kinase GRC3/NOL9
MDVPASWERAAQEIVRHGWRTALILGDVDSGKSTVCRFLARRLGGPGTSVGFVDADVGQKDLGPPASITLGEVGEGEGLEAAELRAYYFVGATAPSGHLLPMVVGARRMLDASRADVVIVNTTGLIHGLGRVLKHYKIEVLRPDVLVALDARGELGSILHTARNRPILRLDPSPRRRAKSPDTKRQSRERAFGRYFAQAAPVTLPLAQLVVQRSLLFTGQPIDGPGALHAERTAEGIVTVGAASSAGEHAVLRLPAGFERNLLCGVVDGSDEGLGLAILRAIDFARGTISLVTPVPADAIAGLQLGDLHVGPDGTELGRGSPARA